MPIGCARRCSKWRAVSVGVRVTRAKQPARTLHRRETQPGSAPGSGSAPAPEADSAGGDRSRVSRSQGAASPGGARGDGDTGSPSADAGGYAERRDARCAVSTRTASRCNRAGAARCGVSGAASIGTQFRAQVRAKSQPLLARGCRVTVTGPSSPIPSSGPTGAETSRRDRPWPTNRCRTPTPLPCSSTRPRSLVRSGEQSPEPRRRPRCRTGVGIGRREPGGYVDPQRPAVRRRSRAAGQEVCRRWAMYALVDVPITLDLTGVMNEPLVLIPAAAGWLVVGELQSQVSATTAESLRAQDAIVRVLATRATGVLPIRFGTCFENETALQNRMARFTAESLRYRPRPSPRLRTNDPAPVPARSPCALTSQRWPRPKNLAPRTWNNAPPRWRLLCPSCSNPCAAR